MSKSLIGRKEACLILGITLATLHKLTSNGTIRGFKIGGKVKYYEDDLHSALKQITPSVKISTLKPELNEN